jgi:hypothetical protein
LLNEISRFWCFFCRAQENQSSTPPQSRRELGHLQILSKLRSREEQMTTQLLLLLLLQSRSEKREAARMPQSGRKDSLGFQNQDPRAKREAQPIVKKSHVSDLTVVAVVATLWS